MAQPHVAGIGEAALRAWFFNMLIPYWNYLFGDAAGKPRSRQVDAMFLFGELRLRGQPVPHIGVAIPTMRE
jgi:hypothetical protein